MNIKKGDLSGFSLVGNHFKQEETGRKTIFAGNILQTGKPNGKTSFDRTSQIREEAQKKAAKIVEDVFDAEKKFQKQIQDMKDMSQEYVEIRSESIQELQNIEAKKEELSKAYEGKEDSQEYLSLLKEQDEMAQVYQNKLEQAETGISGINSSLRSIQIERLKSDPMVEARSQAEEIMKQASKDIIGAIRGEGMNHVEEKLQEVVDRAKEEAEKKEEEEEKREAVKEKKEQLEKQIQAVKENTSEKEENLPELEEMDMDVLDSYNKTKKQADQELEKLIDNLERVMDDLKGAAVDVNL